MTNSKAVAADTANQSGGRGRLHERTPRVEDLLGLQTGEAHIIGNAGGVVTEDALRCLIITHHLLDTNEIILSTTPAAACSRSEPRPDVFQTGAQLWPPAMQLLPNRKRRPAAAQGVAA